MSVPSAVVMPTMIPVPEVGRDWGNPSEIGRLPLVAGTVFAGNPPDEPVDIAPFASLVGVRVGCTRLSGTVPPEGRTLEGTVGRTGGTVPIEGRMLERIDDGTLGGKTPVGATEGPKVCESAGVVP